MMVKAIVIEQLERDGSLRTLMFQGGRSSNPMVVAFVDEYDDLASGPFHFHDDASTREFSKAFAECSTRHVAGERFRVRENAITYTTSWQGIPTERCHVTFFALSLPQRSRLDSLQITDPYNPGREFKRKVVFDRLRDRHVVYLRCSSRYGSFSFGLTCELILDAPDYGKRYSDDYTVGDLYVEFDVYKYVLPDQATTEVNNFFQGPTTIMRDYYNVRQAGAVGPGASTDRSSFIQTTAPEFDFDSDLLVGELLRVRSELLEHAQSAEDYSRVASLAAAAEAAQKGDTTTTFSKLKEAGQMALDVAKELTTKIAAEVIAHSMGFK